MMNLYLFPLLFFLVGGYAQSNLIINNYCNKDWKYYKGYKQKRNNEIVVISNDISFYLNNPIRIERNLSKNLEKDYLYKFSINIKVSKTTKALDVLGVSFMQKKGKFIYDEGSTSFMVKNENILYPYLSFIDTLYADSTNHLSFFVLASGEESKVCIRRIPIDYIKDNDSVLVSINNLSLVSLGRAEKYRERLNVISNGDFEFYYSCPSNIGYPQHFIWQEMAGKYHPCVESRDVKKQKTTKTLNLTNDKIDNAQVYLDLGTPDLVSVFSRKSLIKTSPPSGRNYARLGIGLKDAIYHTEYLQTKFKPLERGKKYVLTFMYRLAPYSKFDVNRLGVKFGECPFSMDELNGVIKHKRLQIPKGDYMVELDSSKHWNSWQKATYSFVATGKENYLTIGAFYPNNEKFIEIESRKNDTNVYDHRVWYFIDNVILVEQK